MVKRKTLTKAPMVASSATRTEKSVQKRAVKLPRRTRLDPEERREQILQKAIHYFAENGFGANTRELAAQIGIAQSLLYHYFPSKESMLEQIYHELYPRRWKQEWEDLFTNRSIPLKERLIRFYLDYAATVQTRESVRIFFFAGLRDVGIHRKSFELVRSRIYLHVIAEIRAQTGKLGPSATEPSCHEIELAWQLHGAVFYLGVRKHVLNLPSKLGLEEAISMAVTVFLDGAITVTREKL